MNLTYAWRTSILILLSFRQSAMADMEVVKEGRPAAVVVVSDKPSAVAQYAAEELVLHVEKATGAHLEVMRESDLIASSAARIFIGNCQATREAEIPGGALEPEAYVMRTVKGNLHITGDDGRGEALDKDTRAGTLWGVYEWLERTLQVRWLWPGDLGTSVPKTASVVAKEVNETAPPRFFQRRLRPGTDFVSEHPALGFTPVAAEKFAREQAVFLRRHRMGRSYAFGYGHAFVDWWEKAGKAHPEWFQLREGGKRGPSKPKGRFSMCVSSAELQREIVRRWQERGGNFINACENDILGLCTCGSCRALDEPAPEDYLRFYPPTSKMTGSRFVSDRYAHFWLEVQKLAAQSNPNATVVGYAYFNYFSAPTSGIRLNPHILIGFCPSAGWFPRAAEEHEWMKRQWTGWRETGARLFMRTNHLLDGYCMPFIFAHQFTDEFHHAVGQGMVATDYDSLTGHWATQGPNLYVAVRLHTRPEASADDLLAEYYAAFGSASGAVKKYFDYWEGYTTAQTSSIGRVMTELETSRWRNFAKAAHVLFPAECFAPADALLQQAAGTVAAESEAAARVRFLQQGFDHAKLCARTGARLSLAAPELPEAEAKALLDEVMRFRRAAERSGISNFNHLAWVEDLSWRLSPEAKKAPDLYP